MSGSKITVTIFFTGSFLLFHKKKPRIICQQIQCICLDDNGGCESKMRILCLICISIFGAFS